MDVPSWNSDEPPTSDEAESLFLNSLATGLPEQFVMTPETESVWLLARPAEGAAAAQVGQQPVVLGSRSPLNSYWELFGSWSPTTGYVDGLIVATLRRLEPQLNPAAAPDIIRARSYLLEAIVARRERLSAAATDAQQQRERALEMMAMRGTQHYLQSLLDRLALRAAAAASGH